MPALAAYVHSGGSRQARRAFGGAEETRTPDFLLAKEALYQLSYGPVSGCAAFGAASRTKRSAAELLESSARVGASGLEPETSALSGQCSNQLS